MNVIQSKFTGYLNPETTGMGDEYSVPVKGTPYQNVKGFFGSVICGTKEDVSAALRCGTKQAAQKVVALMNARKPLLEVSKAASEGIQALKEERVRAEEATIKRLENDSVRRREKELARIWNGVEPHDGARFKLRDVNPYFYNCGHYPEWIVEYSADGEYASLASAEEAAKEKNEKSHRAWLRFLNS